MDRYVNIPKPIIPKNNPKKPNRCIGFCRYRVIKRTVNKSKKTFYNEKPPQRSQDNPTLPSQFDFQVVKGTVYLFTLKSRPHPSPEFFLVRWGKSGAKQPQNRNRESCNLFRDKHNSLIRFWYRERDSNSQGREPGGF